MKKYGGASSQTNMVLYTIIGIFLVGVLFFGVGFKVGNRMEGFANRKEMRDKRKEIKRDAKQKIQDLRASGLPDAKASIANIQSEKRANLQNLNISRAV